MKTFFMIHRITDVNRNHDVFFDLADDLSIHVLQGHKGDKLRKLGRYLSIGEALTDILQRRFKNIPITEITFVSYLL